MFSFPRFQDCHQSNVCEIAEEGANSASPDVWSGVRATMAYAWAKTIVRWASQGSKTHELEFMKGE